MTEELKKSKERDINGPYNRFIYALKAPESKRQYPKRLEVFLNFIDIGGPTFQERTYNFYHKAKSNTKWLQNSLIDFIIFQKEQVSKGEIVESTYILLQLYRPFYSVLLLLQHLILYL